jgi:predicted Zn-dependent protease
MVVAARELRVHGHEDVAMEMVARALAWYRAQPEDGTRKDNRQFEIAEALYLSRDWSGAQKAFRALAEADTSNFILKGYLGTIAARLGDSVTARRTIAAFDMLRSTLPRPHAEAGYWQGKIAAILGDEERAIAWWKDSMGAQGRSGGVHTDFDFERMWHTKAFREFVRPKG